MKRRSLTGIAAALAVAVTSIAATPAEARHGHDYRYGRYDSNYGGYRNHRGDYYRSGYRDYRRGDYYRGDGYRGYRGYRCRDNGTGGAIIGAIAGGLLGHEVAGRGDRTTGTVVGGALGAVTGHLIDKNNGRRC